MSRITNRHLIGGFVFFVFIVGGSLFYSWHMSREHAARTAKLLQQLGTDKRVHTVPDADLTAEDALDLVDTPLGTTNTGPVSKDSDALSVDGAEIHGEMTIDLSSRPDAVSDEKVEEEVVDVPVSPFGFGPYPDIPDGMSIIPWEKFPSANHELIRRVRIKLWKSGIQSDGGVMENGLVYPTVRGRVYLGNGRMHSHPDDNLRVVRGKVPDLSGFDVYTLEKGVEPYSYLNLER